MSRKGFSGGFASVCACQQVNRAIASRPQAHGDRHVQAEPLHSRRGRHHGHQRQTHVNPCLAVAQPPMRAQLRVHTWSQRAATGYMPHMEWITTVSSSQYRRVHGPSICSACRRKHWWRNPIPTAYVVVLQGAAPRRTRTRHGRHAGIGCANSPPGSEWRWYPGGRGGGGCSGTC